MKTLYERFKELQKIGIEDIDIYDNTIDTVFAWVETEREEEIYDKCTKEMSKGIEVIKCPDNKTAVCDLYGYVIKNREIFEKITERAKIWIKPGMEEEDVAEIGIMTIHGLVAGYFCDGTYEKMYELLTERKGI